jgi:heptaprenyl diphosphate synthase
LPKQLRKVADRELLKTLEAGLEQVEAQLKIASSHAESVINSPSRHLVDAGGKRVRPTLVLLSSLLGDGFNDNVIRAAVVVELTHLATLYHDDVMDEAPTRRGVPTAQTVWGNSVAILTGDLLFARASKVGLGLGDDSLKLQSETFERLCLGQLHETIGPVAGQNEFDHYVSVLADKTGSLIAASAQLGAMLSNADPSYIPALSSFGEKVGVAFQLIDDVIDISEEGPSGKTPGTDLRAGVPTLPTLLLSKLAVAGDAKAQEILDDIAAGLASDDALKAVLLKLRSHRVFDDSLAEARRWASDAIADLAPLPEGKVKNALTTFAQAVVDRNN